MRHRQSLSILRAPLYLVPGFALFGAAVAWALLTHTPVAAEEVGPQLGAPQVMSCVGLNAPAWKDREVDTTLDMQNGLLTVVYYGAGDSFVTLTVRYQEPSCQDNATLRDLIDHVVSEANEDVASECAALQQRLASANFTSRGRMLNPAAAVAYIKRWC